VKAERKRIGTKAEIRALKEREKHIASAILIAVILTVLVLSAYFGYTFLTQSSNPINNPTPESKAAIVDQASLSPAGGLNQAFITNVTSTLNKVGYTVDYYSGEKVTVEFYESLATHDYRLIILRAHSAVLEGSIFFFTSERYSQTSHLSEQLNDQLVRAAYSEYEAEIGIVYFGITPLFVSRSMKGSFQNTTIIMTGCEGLVNPTMASAFVKKGARVYFGWDKAIFFSHTDTATVSLLQHLLVEKQTINQAVEDTVEVVEPDPAANSTLKYYPLNMANQKIETPQTYES
jgi:FlaG/FlaF family flagellin (archaellin)